MKSTPTIKRILSITLTLLLAVAAPALVQAQVTESYTFTTNRIVPDGDSTGLSDVRTLNSAIGSITSVRVRLKITGEFNGDLYGYLRHSSGFTVLLNRPGKTAADPHGYPDSGLNVTFQTGAANGDIHLHGTVPNPADGLPLTGTWEPDSRGADPDTVMDASARNTSLTSFNGLSAAGNWTLYLADMDSGGTNMLTEWGLDITGAAYPTLTWSAPADLTYGTPLSAAQLSATASCYSSNVSGTFTYTPAAGSVLSAGSGQTLSVSFTPADPSSFLPVTTNVTINVLPAALVVTANDANRVYGAANPAFTGSVTGLQNGDAISATFTTTATASSDVGAYAIVPTLVDPANKLGNYTVTTNPGTLTVTAGLTSGALASSANPALPGTAVTFTMSLSTAAGTPGGTVNFRIDGAPAGSATLSGGAASLTLSSLPHGSHTVTAEYAGNANFIGTTNALAQAQIINTMPMANALTLQTYPGQGVKVRASALLANASDADGDTLGWTVSSSSAHSGTITVSGGWVYYTPAPGYTNADSFTYTVSDPYGGSATGTVLVALNVNPELGQNLAIFALGNGTFRIDGSGIPGRTYKLQYSDTSSPFNWQDLLAAGTLTADSAGAFQYTDTSASSSRLYRSVSQ